MISRKQICQRLLNPGPLGQHYKWTLPLTGQEGSKSETVCFLFQRVVWILMKINIDIVPFMYNVNKGFQRYSRFDCTIPFPNLGMSIEIVT